MQPHDMKGRRPDKNNPGAAGRQTKWLLLIIAILLGLVLNHLLRRLI
jgi:hypothetical protein